MRGAGLMAALNGNAVRGAAQCEEARRISAALGDRAGCSQASNHLAVICRDTGDFTAAVAHFAEALALAREVGELWATCWALDGLAGAARARGELDIAARLLACSGKLATRAGYRPPPHERVVREADVRGSPRRWARRRSSGRASRAST